ncbi:MAG TPA: hypothetical protein VMG82_11790 [Candidatus Sulfotelmatobacter sp.]|nr:hypothetical protein [Candidatus Sulfotelmatobacter sp.]
MLIVMGQTGNRTLHKAAARSVSPDDEHKTLSQRKHLTDVLSELRDLLEDYSPAWYTEEHQRKVESALHNKRK